MKHSLLAAVFVLATISPLHAGSEPSKGNLTVGFVGNDLAEVNTVLEKVVDIVKSGTGKAYSEAKESTRNQSSGRTGPVNVTRQWDLTDVKMAATTEIVRKIIALKKAGVIGNVTLTVNWKTD